MILTEGGQRLRIGKNLFRKVAILGSLLVWGCNTELSEKAAHESKEPSGKFLIACLGDSITYGAGTSDPTAKSYPSQLQSTLGSSYEVKNFGVSGSTATAEDSERSYMATKEFDSALNSNAQLFVIMLGTNDGERDRWSKVKDQYSLDLSKIIRSVKLLRNAPKILVVAPIPAPGNERDTLLQNEVAPAALMVASEEGVDALDLRPELEGKVMLFPDSLHPNDDGAKIIADAVAKKITEIRTMRQDFQPTR